MSTALQPSLAPMPTAGDEDEIDTSNEVHPHIIVTEESQDDDCTPSPPSNKFVLKNLLRDFSPCQ